MLLDITVNFQRHEVSLSKLIQCKNSDVTTENALNELLNLDALNQVITVGKTEEIGSEPLRLSGLEVAHAKRYKEVLAQNLVNSLLENSAKPALFIISGIGKERNGIADELIRLLSIGSEKDKETIKGYLSLLQDSSEYKKIIIVTSQDEEDNLKSFRRLCHNNSRKIIHWIKITNNQFYWQQLYDPAFYVNRKFNHQVKTVIKRDIVYSLSQESPPDLCVFSNIDQNVNAVLFKMRDTPLKTKEEIFKKKRLSHH
jgi:hypothetical protein